MSLGKGEQMEFGEEKPRYQIPQGDDKIKCIVCRDETRFCQYCERGKLAQEEAIRNGEDIWHNKKAS